MSEATEFFQVGGPLSEDAPSYIERPADKELLTALERGELCLVLAPRQSGKSSLMVHALARLKKKGIQAGIVDLQQLGSHETLDRWFSDVVYQIERSFRLETDSTEWWEANNRLGPTQRFMTFVEDVILSEVEGNVVIFFDEIDSTLPRPFSDDFFTTLRSLYNARGTNPTLKRLSFVLLGVATASAFVKDRSRTPFNIGRSIELGDFDKASTEPFQHVLGPDSEPLVNRIFYWTSGQPFLIQKLAATAFSWAPEERNAEKLDEEVKTSYLHRKIEQDTHLKFMQDYLLDTSINVRKTLKTYDQILRGKKIPYNNQSTVQSRLKLAGVVRVEDRKLAPRNRIYQNIFNLQWVKQHIPREIQKKIVYSVASVLAVLFLWMYIVQSLFFPRFPQVPKIIKYTAKPSIEIELSIVNANVSRATLDGKDLTVQGDLIRERLGSLPVGESKHKLQLVGGLFKKTHDIPVEVVYYPNWEIRQFPDKRLEQLNPILEYEGTEVRLRDVMNGKILATLEHQSTITSAVLSPDRKFVLSGTEDGSLKLWDTFLQEQEGDRSIEPKELQTFSGHAGAVLSLAFSPGGKVIISGSLDTTLKVWLMETGQELHTFSGHKGAVHSVAFSSDGRYIISGSEDRTLRLWDIVTGESQTFSGHDGTVHNVAFSPDGKMVLSGSGDRTLKLWDRKTGKALRTLTGHTGAVRSVAFSPDGKWILSGSEDTMMKLWKAANGENIKTFNSYSDVVDMVGFSSGGQLIFGYTNTGVLKVWNVATGHELQAYAGHSDAVWGVAFSPDGKTVISGSDDTTLKLWDVETGQELHTFSGHSGWLEGVAFSPDGKTVISGSEDRTLKLWDVETGQELRTFSGHNSEVRGVTFSPDGKMVVSGSNDTTVKLWDVETGQELRTFSGHKQLVRALVFSPDGKTVLSGSDDNTLKLWDVETAQELRTFSGHSAGINGVAFSPDGTTVISGSADGTLKLWDVETAQELHIFSGHSAEINGVAFSPDGTTVISGSADGTLKLWDVQTPQELRTFSGHSDRINGVAFSPEGTTVISASEDETLKLWWAAVEPKIPVQPTTMEIVKALLFPKFPEIPKIVKHTPELPVQIEVPLANSNVSCVLLDEQEVHNTGKKAVFQDQTIYPMLYDLPVGESKHTLKLVGGLFSQTREIPIEVTYYPGWEMRRFPDAHIGSIRYTAFSQDGETVQTGSTDGTLKFWDLKTGQLLQTISGLSQQDVNILAFSPDGKQALSGSEDGTLKLWNVEAGQEVRSFSGHTEAVSAAVFTPDGKTLLSGSENGTLKLWEVESGKELQTFSGHAGIIYAVAFAPDGTHVLSGGEDTTLKLWEVETGQEVQTFTGHEGRVYTVAFAPDGKTVISGSGDNTLKLWDVETGKELHTFSGYRGDVLPPPLPPDYYSGDVTVDFSPDGKRVVSSNNWDNTLKLWDVETGQELRSFSGHRGSVRWVAFAPDGKSVISGSDDKSVRIWWAVVGEE